MGDQNTEECDVKNEVTSDSHDVISTPSPSTQMILTAVNFLNNPKVAQSPLSQKIAFLKKKGLTDKEVESALKQASQYSGDSINRKNFAPLVVSPPPLIQHVPFWSRVNRIGTSIIVIGIALYGIHRFYKLYIEPWLFGAKGLKRHSQADQLVEISRSLSQLKRTVAVLEETVSAQKMQMDKFFLNEVNEYMPTPVVLSQVRAEINSLKSLLLSRHQFPAIPKPSATIPQWQMSDIESDETEHKTLETAELSETEPMINGKVDENVPKICSEDV